MARTSFARIDDIEADPNTHAKKFQYLQATVSMILVKKKAEVL